MKFYINFVFGAVLAAIFSSPSFGGVYTVNSASSTLTLRGTDFSTNSVFANTFPLPQSGTMSLTGPGASASVDYSFSDAGLLLSNLSYALDSKAFAETTADFRITPLVDITYSLTGSLNPTGGIGTPSIFGHISDITMGEPGTIVFNQQVQKAGTTNQSVALTPNMGTLLSGHEYLISFDVAPRHGSGERRAHWCDGRRVDPARDSATGGLDWCEQHELGEQRQLDRRCARYHRRRDEHRHGRL
jgi:hypothetical protein